MPALNPGVFQFPFPEGVNGRIVRRNGCFEIEAEVADSRIAKIMTIGNVPERLESELRVGLRFLLQEQMIIIAERNGPLAGSTTRQQLRSQLNQLRRLSAKGMLAEVPSHLLAELRSLEFRRREGLFYYSWHGREVRTAEDILRLTTSFAEVSAYVAHCLRDAKKLCQLTGNILAFLRDNPEATREALARKSAFQQEKHIAVEWSFRFWTGPLGHTAQASKGLVAFCDAVLRLSGIELRPAAIQKQLQKLLGERENRN